MMEHILLFFIVIFQVLLFSLSQDLGGIGIVPYLLPKCFWAYESMVESCWAEDMEQSLYNLDPNTRKITRRLEKLH